MSGTTSRRCRICSRRSSARCARPSSPTTSCRPAASPSARSCRSAPASTSSAPAPTGISAPIIKTYRDWKLSGDTEWLKRYWPQVKRAVEYAWSKDNPDHWDPGADRRPLRPPAPDARHGAVQAELLARLDVCRGAAGRVRDGGGAGRARTSPTNASELGRRRRQTTSTTSCSTAAGSSRRSTSPTRACSSAVRHRPQGRRARRRLHGDLLVRRAFAS